MIETGDANPPHPHHPTKLMECLYIILEAGCNIRRLSITNPNTSERSERRIVLMFDFNENAWTIKSASSSAPEAVNEIYACLEAINIISRTEWQHHKINFLCHGSSNSGSSNNNGNKNIEIMQFVMNAMKSGWRVRKSLTHREYKFNKRHNMKYKYLSGRFLSKFLDNMNE
jgi:hypothetical protein